jgi:hypothetical protein
MQIQLDHIARGERSLRETCEEEFVHNARARDPNGTFLFRGWMSGHHHAAQHTFGSHWHFRAVVEAAHRLTFRALLKLIWWEVQTCLDEWVIEHRVVFASGHKGEASQVSQHGPCAILAIEPCAAVRGLISPVQPGRTRKEVLESPCLPGAER